MNIQNLICEFIEKNKIATKDEITLVTDINGYKEETLNSIILARTGYLNPGQLCLLEEGKYLISEELKSYYNIERGKKETHISLISDIYPEINREKIEYFVENYWDKELSNLENLTEFKSYLYEKDYINWWDKN